MSAVGPARPGMERVCLCRIVWRAPTRAVLSRRVSLGRDFRWLWSGNAAGNMADGIAFVAIPLTATTLTSNPALIAGLSLAYSLVRVLLVVPVGVIVDRVDRRLLMWAPNVTRGAIFVGVSVTFAVGAGNLLLLYAAFMLVGVMEIAADNAAISVLPTVVDAGDLDRANGRIATAQLVADEFVGPPVGGVLFATAVAAPLAATGGLYTAAGLLFLAMAPRPRPVDDTNRVKRHSMWRDAADGARWIRGQRLLLGLAITSGLASVAYMMTFSILVLYATDLLRVDSTGYGVILAVSSLGGLVGSSTAARLRAAFGIRRVIPAALALGAVTMAGLAFTKSPIMAGVLLAGYVLHVTVWIICALSVRQRLVPDHQRGRQNSLFKLSGLIGLTLGAAVAGPIVDSAGLVAPFGIAAVILGICAVYTRWLSSNHSELADGAA